MLRVALLLLCCFLGLGQSHPAFRLADRPGYNTTFSAIHDKVRKAENDRAREEKREATKLALADKKSKLDSFIPRRRLEASQNATSDQDDPAPADMKETKVRDVDDKLMLLEINDSGMNLTVWVDLSGNTHIEYFKNSTGEQWEVSHALDNRLSFNFTNAENQTYAHQPSEDNFQIEKLVPLGENATTLVPDDFTVAEEMFLTKQNCCMIDYEHVSEPMSDEVTIPGIGLYLWAKAPEDEDSKSDIYNYAAHGDDWPDTFPECDNSMQAPLDLLNPVTKYGNTYKFYFFSDDGLEAEYSELHQTGLQGFSSIQSLEIFVSHSAGFQGFSSKIGATLWGAHEKWHAYEVQVKKNSEHTIQGKQMDLELQVFHTPHYLDDGKDEGAEASDMRRRNLQARDLAGIQIRDDSDEALVQNYEIQETKLQTMDFAVIAILFDAKDYDKSLSDAQVQSFYDFFDSLDLETEGNILQVVEFGKLMHSLDMTNRWIYKASMPFPPCHQWVYWNVLQTVYPIRKDQAESVQRRLEGLGVSFTDGIGNVRQPDQKFNKEVYFVQSSARWLALGGAASIFLLFAASL